MQGIVFSSAITLLSITDSNIGQKVISHTAEHMSDGNVLKWSAIIIPCLVTIAGLIITNKNTKRGFEESLKQKNNDQKREVYTTAFIDVDELITKKTIVFENDYFEKIVSHKAIIKLCGSIDVISCYEDVFYFCLNTISAYWEWIVDNHPRNKYSPDEQYGYEYEEACEIFDQMCDQYKKEHSPDSEVLYEKVTSLLNEMRKDLGNESVTLKQR